MATEPTVIEVSEPGIWVATIAIDEDESVTVDFTGIAYWAFRGILERVLRELELVEPPLIITNDNEGYGVEDEEPEEGDD